MMYRPYIFRGFAYYALGILLYLSPLVFTPCAWARLDGETLLDLAKKRQLGLTDQETEELLAHLGKDRVQVDLNKVKVAREGASPELRNMSESLANPFDGSARLSGGNFEGYVPAAPEPVTVDKRGKPKKKYSPRRRASASPGGQCAQAADRAIRALRDLVEAKGQEEDDGELSFSGPFSAFFKTLAELFFPRAQEEKYKMPEVTTGKTVFEDAIATYHVGEPGLLTFDCEKFLEYGESMRRKIACHEYYHWFQNHVLGTLDEGDPYNVMPYC